jgi:hypothetical protein
MKVRFCGNCNPRVDPKRVKAKMAAVFQEEPGKGELLVNGCERMCLTRKRAAEQDCLFVNGWEICTPDLK